MHVFDSSHLLAISGGVPAPGTEKQQTAVPCSIVRVHRSLPCPSRSVVLISVYPAVPISRAINPFREERKRPGYKLNAIAYFHSQ